MLTARMRWIVVSMFVQVLVCVGGVSYHGHSNVDIITCSEV